MTFKNEQPTAYVSGHITAYVASAYHTPFLPTIGPTSGTWSLAIASAKSAPASS